MKKILHVVTAVMMTGLLHSCLLENDISYPYIKGEITAFEVEGQVSSTIDPVSRTVSVVLEETADMKHVKVRTITLNPEASLAEELPEYLDLSERPVTVTVRTYQDYVWTISATQPIERYIRSEGQIGDAVFNDERQVTVYLSEGQDLSHIIINDMKLAPKGAIYYQVSEDGVRGERIEKFPYEFDYSLLSAFDVEYKGEFERWEIEFEIRKIVTDITSVIPWCYSADVNAMFDGTGEPYIRYRKTGEDAWTDFRDVTVSENRLDITARLTGLEAGTGYEAVLVVGDKESAPPKSFSTGSPEQLPNMGFDDWCQDDKMIWYPNLSLSEENYFWDTANGGSALLSIYPTTPEDDKVISGRAVRLETKSVPIAVGIAAGNIYSGKFLKANFLPPGAKLTWGTPFTGRPKSLKGYYAYAPKLVDVENKKPVKEPKELDKCQILVMLTDWDGQFTVDTAKGQFVDQENDPHIIAYAKYESDKDTGGNYEPFELELDYRRPDATPKYAVVIACASYKGDYFTGGVGSVMYVDEFEFVYE